MPEEANNPTNNTSNQTPDDKKPAAAENNPPQQSRYSLPRWFVPAICVSFAVFMVFVYTNNWNLWDGRRNIEVTDDAYVRGEVRPLSTKVAGVVIAVPVTDYQSVKTGDIIAQLRNDDFQAHVDEAKASVDEIQTSLSQLKQQELVQDSRIAAAQSALAISKTNINQALNTTQAARAQVDITSAAIKQTREDIASIEASIRADRANALRANLEQKRQHDLFAERATTTREVEQIDADATAANEAITRDEDRKRALQETLESHIAELEKTKNELANNIDDQSNASNQHSRSGADLDEQIKQKQVLIAQEKVLAAQLAEKQATLKNALVELDYTYIRAPIEGIISERKVFPGQVVSPGTQAATIVSATPWVIANYRETQLSQVFAGNRAEVSIDGLPGRTFKGTVNSISPASEAQFALLPPDNASGNFTKITQRVPVKITFEPNQRDLVRMRPGMSAVAHVWTSSHQ